MWAWTWQVHSGSGKKRKVGRTSSAANLGRTCPQYLLVWSKRRRTDGTTKIEASRQNRSGFKNIPLCTKAISTEPMPDFGALHRQWLRLHRGEIFSSTQTDQLTNELDAALIVVWPMLDWISHQNLSITLPFILALISRPIGHYLYTTLRIIMEHHWALD